MSPTKRGPYRKDDVAQKRLRIKEYVPPNIRKTSPVTTEENATAENEEAHHANENEVEYHTKKKHGSWTDEKELALMRAYANIFPPAWKRGTVSDGWKKVVEQVNAVSPDDTPLEYDACRRNIDKIINIYNNSSTLGGYKYQKEMEEAVSSALSKKEAHESIKGKKIMRSEIEAQCSNEAQEIPSSVTLETQQNDNRMEVDSTIKQIEIQQETFTVNRIESHRRDGPSKNLDIVNIDTSSSEVPPYNYSTSSAPTSTIENQLLEEQRHFQRSMLSVLGSIAKSTRNTEILLEQMLLQLQKKD